MVLAVWNIGAPIDGLKWVPVTASLVAVYSIIGGSYRSGIHNKTRMDRDKAVIGNWELAGAFSHGNFLGAYCALALALIPLITSIRWRILNGLVLCAAIVLTGIADRADCGRSRGVMVDNLWLRSVIFCSPCGEQH